MKKKNCPDSLLKVFSNERPLVVRNERLVIIITFFLVGGGDGIEIYCLNVFLMSETSNMKYKSRNILLIYEIQIALQIIYKRKLYNLMNEHR